MAKKLKRAFTITELVIVIAVVAILAAVLIPTFSNIVQRSRESADTQNVRSMNETLNAVELLEGKPATMTEVIDAVAESGYLVENLTPTGEGYDIVWDEENNRFALIGNEGDVVYSEGEVTDKAWKRWKVVTEIPSDAGEEGNSYYLASGYTGGTVTVSAGVDVGTNADVDVVYANDAGTAKDVTIRTNGGTLTVNAPNDTINHYNAVESVTITAVADNSYHEYGDVEDSITLISGHVVLESGSTTTTLQLSPVDNDASSISVSMNSNATLTSIAANDASILNSENINISDTVEEVVTSNETNALFGGGIGTENNPYQISTAQQFVNIGQLSDEMGEGNAYYFVLTEDIDLRTITFTDSVVSDYFCGELNGNDHKLYTNDNLARIFNDAYATTTFKDINYYLGTNYVALCDGIALETKVTLTFDDVDIYTIESNTIIRIGENEGLYTTWVGASNNVGAYTSYRTDLIIQNCDADVNLSGVSYNAVFIGGGLYNTDAVVKNCTYQGDYYGQYVNLILGNTAHGTYNGSLIAENVVNNGSLFGTARLPMLAAGAIATEYVFATLDESCDLGTCRELKDDTLGIQKDADGSVVIDQATSPQTSYYVLTFVGGTRRISLGSENSSYRFSIRLDAQFADGQFDTGLSDGSLATVAQYQEFIDPSATFDDENAIELYDEAGTKLWIVENDGTTYYVFDFSDTIYGDSGYCYFVDDNNQSTIVGINKALVTAYDSAGLLIGQKELDLTK